MNPIEIIAEKRDGLRHSKETIHHLVTIATSGEMRDYQISSWLMAAYLNGLDGEETAFLTQAMAESGERMDLTGLPKPWVDKHSTGGVGDKTTLVALPVLAACGLTVVKMSGRGLGITGGTVDKLSSIPGFRLDLSPDEMKAQASKIGLALTGQTPSLAPADKIFYALRDSTSTVGSIPLIVSSILSKKIAGGAESIVLDVKAGSGGFMKSVDDAEALAKALLETGTRCGLKLRLAITDMDQPLGQTAGNALEVQEAIDVLSGIGKGRFRDLCESLCGLTLWTSGKASSHIEGISMARSSIDSGEALRRAQMWVEAQGGPVDFASDPAKYLPAAPVVRDVNWNGPSGWVQRWDAGTVGQAVLDLGGGRLRKEDTIDLLVGVVSHVEVGRRISVDQTVCTIHARSEEEAQAAELQLLSGLIVSTTEISPRPVIIEIL